MKSSAYHIFIAIASQVIFTGCAIYQANVGPTPIMQAQEEIPEDQLMDVGILTFESEEIYRKAGRRRRHQ